MNYDEVLRASNCPSAAISDEFYAAAKQRNGKAWFALVTILGPGSKLLHGFQEVEILFQKSKMGFPYYWFIAEKSLKRAGENTTSIYLGLKV